MNERKRKRVKEKKIKKRKKKKEKLKSGATKCPRQKEKKQGNEKEWAGKLNGFRRTTQNPHDYKLRILNQKKKWISKEKKER